MIIEFQSLEIFEPRVGNLFLKNPNRSLSAIYRSLRKNSKLSFFGCYPILSLICKVATDKHLRLSRPKITYALNQSKELRQLSKKEKNSLIDQLLIPAHVQSKDQKNILKRIRNTPADSCLASIRKPEKT